MTRFRRAVAETIKFERERRGISQRQLGFVSCVATTSVSLWERGLHTPSIEGFLALAKAFDMPPTELLDNIMQRMKT